MQIAFTVMGEPGRKGRPRFSTNSGAVYTDSKTVSYENLIRVSYQQAYGNTKFAAGEMLCLLVVAYFSIPESAAKKKKAMMESGELRPVKKPDFDNISKVVADSLNKVAFYDDAQFVNAQIDKRYSRNPRVEIYIQNLKDGREQIKWQRKQ